jgi:cellulose synthase/poly-beta-1,6-N-acetylglucosamine synthase-like glycosyltransferase
VNGFKIRDGRILERSFSYSPILAYQNLEYIRAFFGNRMAWSRYNSMPIVAGGFGIWRKDLLYSLGGFSTEFTCEDIEFTFRAHEFIGSNPGKGYRILMLPYYVGWTEGPSNFRSLIIQRERWQRVTNETVWRYKHLLLNPRHGMFSFVIMPYFILYEVLGIVIELASLIFVVAGYLAGVLDIRVFAAFIALMALTQTINSLIALYSFVRTQRILKAKYILYMILLSFAEFFVYRWAISVGKLLGTVNFLRGVKKFSKYERAAR